MRLLPWALLALAAPALATAQAAPPRQAPTDGPARADEAATIIAVVQRYIDALEARDTAYVRAASLPGATTIALPVPDDAGRTPAARSVDEVVAGLARQTRRFQGRVWAARVTVEGPIAVFVAPYDAWYDGRFSHCGVDHYILVRAGERWLVSQLVFTRQREGCAPSPLGPPA